MKKVTTCLWFDNNGEEAMNFYKGIFKEDFKEISKSTNGDLGRPENKDQMLVGYFTLKGHNLMILNGGPTFKLSEAVSLSIDCDDQKEIDYYWDKLLEDGGQTQACGWLKDKFGLSWQIVPAELEDMMTGPNAKKVMDAVMGMIKLDINKLREAAKS